MSYCGIAPGHLLHGPYHQDEHGFPTRDDRVIFERLVLEINQAGLSWLVTLKKRPGFRAAFADYDLDAVAAYGPAEVERLSADLAIVRNRRKIEAVIENARRLVALRQRHGSLAAWLDSHHPMTKPDWLRLLKRELVFMGGEIAGEFLMSLGYLPGAHDADCPVQARVLAANPPWLTAARNGFANWPA